MSGDNPQQRRRSLFSLVADIPRLITDLARSEIESLKREIAGKLAAAGVGIGLLAAAAAFAFFALAVLVAAAVLGLAVVLPAWAAALIVAGVLLILGAALVAAGVGALKRGMPPTPEKTIDSIKQDVRVIKGIGKD